MNILTFDIEDWWVYDYYSIGKKEDYLPRLNTYLNQILDILEEKDILATFFCLGEVALHYPTIIKDIAKRGHDIGCHSFGHHFFENATPKEFSDDTYKALDTIQNIIGKKVLSYRAPAFSITEKNNWAFEILIENGIEYDCSIFPAKRDFGGYSSFHQKGPSLINYKGSFIKEFPISISSIFGKEIVYSGGGYFRLFPYPFIKSIMNKSDYVMTYFHIKDFDKEQKRIYSSFNGASASMRYLKNYLGLKGNYSKFRKLISDFDFVSVEQAAKLIDWDNSPTVLI